MSDILDVLYNVCPISQNIAAIKPYPTVFTYMSESRPTTKKDASLCHNMEQTHQSSQFLFTTPSAIPHAQLCPCRLPPHNSTVSRDAVSTLYNSLQQFCIWTVSFACRTASSEGAWELVMSQARPMGQNRTTCEGTVFRWGGGVKVVHNTDSVQFLETVKCSGQYDGWQSDILCSKWHTVTPYATHLYTSGWSCQCSFFAFWGIIFKSQCRTCDREWEGGIVIYLVPSANAEIALHMTSEPLTCMHFPINQLLFNLQRNPLYKYMSAVSKFQAPAGDMKQSTVRMRHGARDLCNVIRSYIIWGREGIIK